VTIEQSLGASLAHVSPPNFLDAIISRRIGSWSSPSRKGRPQPPVPSRRSLGSHETETSPPSQLADAEAAPWKRGVLAIWGPERVDGIARYRPLT
jgi:hypothetical protein